MRERQRRNGPHGGSGRMKDRPAKGVKYLNMGPWPGFIGLVFEERAFNAEMKRFGINGRAKFLSHDRAGATLHEFVSPNKSCVWLLALGPVKGRTKEQVAGLVAHEAVHIIQMMREELGDLGKEGEAYLVQMIVQEALQLLWKSNKVRSTTP